MRFVKSCVVVLMLLCENGSSSCCLGQTSSVTARGQVVATLGGNPIYEEDLLPFAQAQFRQLRRQEYDIKLKALEALLGQRALEKESKARGLASGALLKQEVDSAVAEPTEGEVEAYYLGQASRSNRPFDEVKEQIKQALRQAKLQRARQDYVKRLRQKAQVSILLRPPRADVGYDPLRLKGSPNAPVIIVEFSDFQCPFCREAQPILKDLLAKYRGRVSLAYRDFPLSQIHPRAQQAAEAARCAGEQGKFWEYHDLLFANSRNLDRSGLIEHAFSLGLDTHRFDVCLTSGKYGSKVNEDLHEGLEAGVSGTPGFFINGVFLGGTQSADVFEKTIEAELAGSQVSGGTLNP